MTVGPWVDRAFVGLLVDDSKLLSGMRTALNRSMVPLQQQMDRFADGIERRFDNLADEVGRSLDRISGGRPFNSLATDAEMAAERVERSFEEMQREAGTSLDRISGANPFTGLTTDAEVAAEQIEESFDEAQRDADASLRGIGGPGQFTGIHTQAERTARGVEREFRGMRVASVAHFGALRLAAGGAGIAIAAGLGIATVAAATMGIKTAASLEQAQISFEELLGSGKQAQTFLQDLADFAAKTPFELPGLISNARQLLGAGQAAKDVIPILQDLGDATGALGLDQEQFNRIMLATTQSMNKGKIQGEELMQFTEAGIPIWRELSRALGLPIPKLQEMSQKGELLSKDVLPKLFDQLHKDYGGAMVRQSTTLNGLWSTFMDTINIGLAKTIKPFEDELKGGLKTAIDVATRGFQALPAAVERAAAALDESDIPERIVAAGRGIADAVRPWAKSIIIALKTGIQEGEWRPFRDTVHQALTTAVGVAAKETGNTIIVGLATGLREGDWGPLGDALSAHVVDLFLKVPEAVRGLPWMEIGHQAAIALVPFTLGLVGGLADGLIAAFSEDFWGTLLNLAMIVPIGRAAGILGKAVPILLRVPFLGGILKMFEGAGRALEVPIRGFVDRFGAGLLEGFTRQFPRIGGFLERGIGGFARSILSRTRDFRAAGGELLKGLGAGIGEQFGLVVKNIGQTIRFLTRPFAGIGRWLLREGGDLLRGLLTGIRGLWGDVSLGIRLTISRLLNPFRGITGWLLREGGDLLRGLLSGIRGLWSSLSATITTTIRRLLNPFVGAARWLVEEGRQVLQGLLVGVLARVGEIGGLGSWFKAHLVDPIIGAVKRFFGVKSPSTVFAGIGQNLVGGLFQGMLRANPVKMIGTIFGGMPQALNALVGKGLINLSSLPQSVLSKVFGFLGGMIGGTAGSWHRAISELISDHVAYSVVSTFRPGAVTHASGRQSYHALNRAVDLTGPNMMAIWQALLDTSPTELIYSRAPFYIARGQAKPISQLDPVTRGDHFSHVHVAYDSGGYLKPGFTPSWNFTGLPERVLDPAETRIWEALERTLTTTTRPVAAPTPTTVTVEAGAVQIDARGAGPDAAVAIRASVEDGLFAVLQQFRTGSRP